MTNYAHIFNQVCHIWSTSQAEVARTEIDRLLKAEGLELRAVVRRSGSYLVELTVEGSPEQKEKLLEQAALIQVREQLVA